MPRPAPESRVGEVLRDKWTLERLVGWGGMGAVYVGLHVIGRRDAIKILHPDAVKEPNARERFVREARAANLFKHPGAVEITDVDTTDDGAPFLVMELVEGETLAERASRAPLEVDELLGLADQLLDVLAAAHAQGLVHRDIKPENLLVRPNGELKVLDFGIARITHSPMTRTGTALGTVAYMAPEQIRGEVVDARADLFAVGATLFTLLTGRPLHDADSEPELVFKTGTRPAPKLATSLPEAAAGLCLVVDRALAFRPQARYPDARTMQADVRALRDGKPPAYAVERDGPATTAEGADGPVSTRSVPDPAFAPSPPPAPRPLVPAVPPSAPTEVSPVARQALRVVDVDPPSLQRRGLPRWARVLLGLVAVPFLSLGALMMIVAIRKPDVLGFFLVVALLSPGIVALAVATSQGRRR